MFVDQQHISNDGDSSNDEFIEGKEKVIKIGGITTIVLMERTIACLSHTMQEIAK